MVSDSDRNRRRGGRVAAAAWARVDLRGRWRSLVVLGVLAGLTAGFALAALSGARRSDTALARLRARTNASDAAVFASQSGNTAPDWPALARRPEVKTLARWNLMFGEADGEPGSVIFAPSDRMWSGVVDKPVVLQGRMFDPSAADELVVDEPLARAYHIHLGQVLDLHFYLDNQEQGPNAKPQGPDVHLHVVGVVRDVQQFVFVTDGQPIASPGVIARYRKVPHIAILENAYVQLRDPARDAPALQRDVNKIVGNGTPILDFHEVARRVETSTSVETTALLLLFAAVLTAGGVLVGLALSRSASVIGGDVEILRSIGMTRREMTLAATLPHAVTAAVAAGVAVLTALIASRWFPVGVAARLDPDRGVHADWLVLVPGVLALVALVLGASVLVARRASTRRVRRAPRSARGLTSWLRHNTPVSVGVGASMALEPGFGRARVAVRPALFGAMVGVLGVTAAMTINHGLHDALSHPARAGVTWDANVQLADADITAAGVKQPVLERVRAAADVDTASLVDREVIAVNGVGVPTFMFRPIHEADREPIALTLTSGRAPGKSGEAAIGPASARELRIKVGDTVRVGTVRREVKIVGEALFPSDVHAGFDQGLWLQPVDFQATEPPIDPSKGTGPARLVVVRFSPAVTARAGTKRLTSTLGGTVSGVFPADVPVELVNLRNVRTLPVVLAVFLALLAVAAASHALMTSARVRRKEFAILRAIGMTRRGMRSVLNSQATTIAALGLLVGVPIGVIVGRLAWGLVAGRVPLQDVPPLPTLGIVILLPCVVVIAIVIALLPSRRVTRLGAAQVLRAE